MSAPRIAVALVAAFGAMTTSVTPDPNRGARGDTARDAPATSAARPAPEKDVAAPWPPAITPVGPSDIDARLERAANGAQRLVVRKTGTFVHLRYREVTSGGPDWAAIELRAPERAPAASQAMPRDVAVWESTDPSTLETRRGLVSFSLAQGASVEATAAAAPRLGPRSVTPLRTCQSHDDGESGFAVVCAIGKSTGTVRAIRPASKKPLAGAWVWDVPRDPKRSHAHAAGPASRFVRIDLPLSPGGAEGGAIAFVHGGRGVVLRAEATWPSAAEEPALLFTETSRAQPVSPFFDWAPRGRSRF